MAAPFQTRDEVLTEIDTIMSAAVQRTADQYPRYCYYLKQMLHDMVEAIHEEVRERR